MVNDSSDRTAKGYDVLADRATDGIDRENSPWGESHFQEHYSWPAARSIVPDVGGLRVLIAGCGRGDHVGWFLDNGADVAGIDVSETALRTARDRFGDLVSFGHADLTGSLPFDDGSFDLVFSHLVFDHVPDWRPLFEEIRRVLDTQGMLVFAVIHPAYLRDRYPDGVGSYYGRTEITISWSGAEIPTYYRPLGEALESIVETGLRLEVISEPKPLETYRSHAPERYERAMERPEVLCIRARC